MNGSHLIRHDSGSSRDSPGSAAPEAWLGHARTSHEIPPTSRTVPVVLGRRVFFRD